MLQDYTSTENGILVLTSDKTFSVPVLPQISVLVAATTAGWYGKIKKEIHWTQFIENSWINNISVGGKYGNYQSTRLHRPHRVGEWLKVNHNRVKSCWVVTSRSKQPTYECIPYIEVVEEALCFRWIDSTLKKLPGRMPCTAAFTSSQRKSLD